MNIEEWNLKYDQLLAQYKTLEESFRKAEEVNNELQAAIKSRDEEIEGLNSVIKGQLETIDGLKNNLAQASAFAERTLTMMENYGKGLAK